VWQYSCSQRQWCLWVLFIAVFKVLVLAVWRIILSCWAGHMDGGTVKMRKHIRCSLVSITQYKCAVISPTLKRDRVCTVYVTVNLHNQWLREIPSNFRVITDIYWQLLHEITNHNPNPNPYSTPTLNRTLTRHFTKSLITQIYCNIYTATLKWRHCDCLAS